MVFFRPQILFFFSFSLSVSALAKETFNYNVFWSKTVIREPFSDQFGVEVDFVVRRQAESTQSMNIMAYGLRESFRPWLHWFGVRDFIFSISPTSQFRSRPLIEDPLDVDHTVTGERRTTFMAQYYQRPRAINISHRIRLEYRDREISGGTAQARNFRARYRLRFRYPQIGPYLRENQLYGRFFNETMVQWGDGSERGQLNQNRIFLGLGYSFPHFYRMELGYINQTRLSGDRTFYDVSQGVMLYIYFDRFMDAMKGRRAPM